MLCNTIKGLPVSERAVGTDNTAFELAFQGKEDVKSKRYLLLMRPPTPTTRQAHSCLVTCQL
jgi:hypothetical protein